MTRLTPIRTPDAPQAIGPYSQGIRTDDLIFTSGQLPIGPDEELITDDIARATRQALENVFGVLGVAGAQPSDVVKVTIYLADMDDFAAVNETYGERFEDPYPARSCVEVSKLPKDASIMIDAIARVGAQGAT